MAKTDEFDSEDYVIEGIEEALEDYDKEHMNYEMNNEEEDSL
jgi:hypothetical protein